MNYKEILKRLKNKVVWISIISYLIIIFNQFGVDTSNLKTILDAVLSILVVVGILNNPSDNDEF